jgi:hypothetical protein
MAEPEPELPSGGPAKAQPWKKFLKEPEIRPFPADEKAAKTMLRLKSEKDEHGLGG